MKLRLAFVLALVTVIVHLYLTIHFYGLNFGLLDGTSVCNLSAKFNCDTVTASSFSSLFGVPIALWGAVTNGFLALMLLFWDLRWSDDVARLGRYSLWLAGFIAAVSVVMGTISSFFVGSYCVFCMSAYALSFINLYLIWKSQEPNTRSSADYFAELFGPAKLFLGLAISVPILAFIFNYSFLRHYGAQELPQVIHESVEEWKTNPKVELTTPPSLVKGSDHPIMTLSEFADFRCGHCEHAWAPVDAFMDSHPNAQMQFYSFPLDNTCNESAGGGDGISCYLAKAVYCTEKIDKKGWPLHHFLYEDQINVNSNGTMGFAKDQVETYLKNHNIDPKPISDCVGSADTDQAIRNQARLGNEVGVRGTPTFFVNGRMLSRGSLIPVLEAVYKDLESQNSH